MPKAHFGFRTQPIYFTIARLNEPAFAPDAACGLLGFPKLPDQTTGERRYQRVIQVSRLPVCERPRPIALQEVLDAVALGREHLFNVAGELFQGRVLRDLRLRELWLRGQFLAARVKPFQFDSLRSDDLKFAGAISNLP